MKPNSLLFAATAAFFLIGPESRADPKLTQLPTLSQTLSLNDAVRIAEQNNLAVADAIAVRSDAGAEKRRADAALLPSASVSTYGTLGDSNNIVTSSPSVVPQDIISVPAHGFVDQNLTVMVPIYTGGKLSSLASSAKSDSDAAALDLVQSKVAVEAETADIYVDTLLKTNLVQAAQDRLKADDEEVRVSEKEVATGAAAPVDLLREQAEEADATAGLVSAQNEEALDLVQLKTVLGASQQSTLTLSETLDTVSITGTIPSTVDGAVADAEANSPKFASALKRLEAARKRLQSLSGSYLPQVVALGMADATSPTDGVGGRVGYTIGLTASLPLYDAGARGDDIAAARSELQQATIAAEQIRQTIDVDVETEWLKLQAADQQIASAQIGLAAAKEAYRLEILRYSAGKSTDSERLDFLRTQSDADGSLSSAKADGLKARIDIFAAMGVMPTVD